MAGRHVPAAVLAVLLAGMAAVAEVTFDAAPCFGPAAFTHRFVPLRVHLRTTEPFAGRIKAYQEYAPESGVQLEINTGPGEFVYELAAPLARYTHGNQVVVSLARRGERRSHERKFSIEPRGGSGYVHNYGAQGEAGRHLISWVGASEETARTLALSGLPNVGVTTVRQLPGESRLYQAIDVLVLPSAALDALGPAQGEAIVAWVRSGGHLVVDASGTRLTSERSLLLRALDVTLDDQVTQVSIQRKGPLPEDPGRASGRRNPATNAVPAEPPVFDYTLALRPISCGPVRCADATSLRGDIRVGLGRLTITPLDLNRALGSTQGADAGGLLATEIVYGPSSSDRTTTSSYYGYDAPPWAQNLFLLAGLEPISRGTVFTYLLVFFLVVCPLERYVLRRLGKLRWMWLSTAAIVALFCVFAVTLSRVTRGNQARRSMICVHDYAPGGGRHTFLDCFIPAASRYYTIAVPQDGTVMPVAGQTVAFSTTLHERDHALEFSTPVWSPACFVSVRPHDEAPPALSTLFLSNGKIRGSVRMPPDGPVVESAWLLWNGQCWGMKQGPDGTWTPADGPAGFNATPDNSYELRRHGGTPAQRKTLRQFMIDQIVQQGVTGAQTALGTVATPPRPLHSGEARFIAVVDRGARLDMDARNPIVTETHIIRQLLTVSIND